MRLIDADALYDKAESAYKNAPWQIRSTCRWFVDSIADAPTVDAVPVVRCKDCLHWNEDALACDTLPWVSSSEHENWYAEDFCSYGERRSDD